MKNPTLNFFLCFTKLEIDAFLKLELFLQNKSGLSIWIYISFKTWQGLKIFNE